MKTSDTIRHGGLNQDVFDSSPEKSGNNVWGVVLMVMIFLIVIVALALLLL